MHTVYWTVVELVYDTSTAAYERVCYAREFDDAQLGEALKFSEQLRKERREGALISMVTIASEHGDNVGQSGVDSVVDGKTPDGEAYTWSKAGRAGKMRAKDYLPRS